VSRARAGVERAVAEQSEDSGSQGREGGTSEVGDKALACFYAGDEAAACFGPGSTTTCGGGAVVSRATEEREFGSFKQLLSVARESAGPEILGHGHPTCDAPLLHVSSFSYDARHA
jgi:hypothetical protein